MQLIKVGNHLKCTPSKEVIFGVIEQHELSFISNWFYSFWEGFTGTSVFQCMEGGVSRAGAAQDNDSYILAEEFSAGVSGRDSTATI